MPLLRYFYDFLAQFIFSGFNAQKPKKNPGNESYYQKHISKVHFIIKKYNLKSVLNESVVKQQTGFDFTVL
jgi:hypothetical protein